MPMVRAMRLLNAIEAGTTTGAQLETLLTADPGRRAEFNVLLGMRGQMRRMAASSTAMTAVIESATARLAIYNSDIALNAIASSSVAITTITGNPAYKILNRIPSTTSAAAIWFDGDAIIVKLSQSWGDSANTNMVIGNLRAGTAISGTKNNGAVNGTYNATAGVPGNTWVLPAQATATQHNTLSSIGSVLNIGFLYV